jgi:hypothetical protein
MISYYSILKFINNEISQESISLGLVVISGQKLFFKISTEKLKFANRLNPESKKLLEFSIKNLENYFKFNTNGLDLFAPKSVEYQEYLSRLSDYNNGILQISKPAYIKKNFDESSFKLYFEKLIGKDKEDSKIVHPPSLFQIEIEQKLHKPLKEQIDVNYTLKQSSLPSLFFDYHFDGLGYNGSLYGIKSIDLNANKQLASIQSEIAEFESVIDRLNKFAENQNITGDSQYYLIMDSYSGKNPAYNDLYSILKELPSFKLVSSKDIPPIVKDIKKSKAKKLSGLLEG